MGMKKDGWQAIPRAAWIIAVDSHSGIAAELEWLARHSLDLLTRAGDEGAADPTLASSRDAALDAAMEDTTLAGVAKARMRAEREMRTEVGNESLSPSVVELSCLLKTLQRLATRHRESAEDCAHLARRTRRGRPRKQQVNQLLALLGDENHEIKRRARPGPKPLVAISDETLLAIAAMGRNELGYKTKKETFKALAEIQLAKEGTRLTGNLEKRVRYLQRRHSEASSRVRKSKG